mmetsp:Transcript_27759/g.54503  ORF Transcript_27759/g.54503 Transcript_27759/m.54503 type:complete len:218 (+) Transcript_27759:81-734(+)
MVVWRSHVFVAWLVGRIAICERLEKGTDGSSGKSQYSTDLNQTDQRMVKNLRLERTDCRGCTLYCLPETKTQIAHQKKDAICLDDACKGGIDDSINHQREIECIWTMCESQKDSKSCKVDGNVDVPLKERCILCLAMLFSQIFSDEHVDDEMKAYILEAVKRSLPQEENPVVKLIETFRQFQSGGKATLRDVLIQQYGNKPDGEPLSLIRWHSDLSH